MALQASALWIQAATSLCGYAATMLCMVLILILRSSRGSHHQPHASCH